jgi:hypothetical protein
MAKAELRYGHNEQLRRLAEEIVAKQQQEVAVMRHAVGEKSGAAPSQSAPSPDPRPMPHASMTMSHDSVQMK